VQDVAIEEQERTQCLVLGRRGNPALDSQGAEEASNFGRSHLGGMTLAVEEDVAADPPHVGFFGAATAVAKAVGLSHAVEQLGRAWAGLAYDKRDVLRLRIADGTKRSGSHSYRENSAR